MPSVVNNNPKPLEQWIYFVDRSLPKGSLLQALKENGRVAKHHDELFSQDASDVVWLTEAGKNNWIVLSHDRAIARKPLEIESLRRAKVRAFMPAAKGNLKGQEITEIIINALPAIEEFSQKNVPPFIAKIYRDGTLIKWRI